MADASDHYRYMVDASDHNRYVADESDRNRYVAVPYAKLGTPLVKVPKSIWWWALAV